ncbi:hypothetical protein MINTMi27_15280 [Mycobacterium intracellulare]|nr:hypothetical protein MINTMi27_15280 [Mycobacterium intracellulare]
MSTAYPVTHVTVRDTPPPQRPVISVGRLYDCSPKAEPETVFSTITRVQNEEPAPADETPEAETETKVMRNRRGRRPARANEDAETK